jgi:hypothetical protein
MMRGMGPQTADRRPRGRGLFRRLFGRARPEAEAPAAQVIASRGLGEPSSPEAADDAELDTLRGELVRELDRMAAKRGSESG